MKKTVWIILILLLAGISYFFFTSHQTVTQNRSTPQKSSATIIPKNKGIMTITGTAFVNNSTIPAKYTCDGESINPPLQFENVPSNAKSLVMLMDDPDVPKNLKPDGV